MRPVVHLEVIVPRILLPIPPVSPAQSAAPLPTSGSDKGDDEQVRVIRAATNQEVGQSSRVELTAQRPQKKRFRLFRVQNLPIVQDILRLQILRPTQKRSQSSAQPSLAVSDELAFSLEFIQQEADTPQTTTPLNSSIYQVKLYVNAEGMLVGHQIDNSDS